MGRYQKGKTNLDFTEARDSEWQWHQMGRMQVCTLLQTDNHASTPPLCFFTGRMPFLPPNQQRQSTEGIKTSQNISLKTEAELTAGRVLVEVVQLARADGASTLGVTINASVVSETRSSQSAARHCNADTRAYCYSRQTNISWPLHHCCSVAEWLACSTQAQKGPGSNRSRDAVG